MRRFYVIGNPVGHSLSPRMHRLFAQQFDLDISYEHCQMTPGRFIEEMAVLRREQQPFGCNVTAPFKSDAADYCDELTERARLAGAANTLSFIDGKCFGDNTDGVGFVNDIQQRCGIDLKGQRVLILGAGGATRGLLSELRSHACACVAVANRTLQKAEALGADFPIRPLSYTDTADGRYDVVINATSAAFSNAAPAVPNTAFQNACIAYDLAYGPQPSPFMRLAMESGCSRVEDGLGMLVEQGAESFRIWFGLSPQTGEVYRILRSVVG